MNRSMSPSAVSASNDWLTWYTPALKLVVIIVIAPEISATILMTMNPRMVERIMSVVSPFLVVQGEWWICDPELSPDTCSSVIVDLWMSSVQVAGV